MKRSFTFYHQHDNMDCGPACLRMVAKYYGKSYCKRPLLTRTSTPSPLFSSSLSLNCGFVNQATNTSIRASALSIASRILCAIQVGLILWMHLPFGNASEETIYGKRSRQNVYDSRQRLVKAIEETAPKDREEFLRYLANRPTRAKNITISSSD